MRELSDSTIDGFVRSGVAVVDCYTTWCGPCKQLAPTLEALARDYGSRVAFGKIDTEKNPDTQARFFIQGVPTLLFFKNGSLVRTIGGAVSADTIRQAINSL